jgi:hypothetical protein
VLFETKSFRESQPDYDRPPNPKRKLKKQAMVKDRKKKFNGTWSSLEDKEIQ